MRSVAACCSAFILGTPSLALAGNTSLTGKLVSEDFADTAVSGAAKPTLLGGIAGTAGASTVSIRYDAAHNSYTVANVAKARSQTFSTADIAAGGDAALVTYKKTAVGATDALTLTTATSFGKGGYQWVKGGWWLRSGGTAGQTYDVIAFGIPTAGAAVPHTGAASYAIGLYGIGAWERAQTTASGTGTMSVDFATSRLAGSGEVYEFNSSTKSLSSRDYWSLAAKLSAASNSVSGTFQLDANGQIAKGGLKGRFYGPAGQEFGATAFARGVNYAGKGAFTAVLLGSRTVYSNPSANIVTLAGDQTYGPYLSTFYGTTVAADGTYKDTFYNGSPIAIDYTATGGVFAVRDVFNGEIVASSAFAANTKLTNDRFLGYARQSPLYDGTVRRELQLYRRGPANPEIQFSYLSFAHAVTMFTGADKVVSTADRWIAFGLPTYAANVLLKGHATYKGVLYGTAKRDGRAPSYRVEGTTRIVADFVAQTVSGTMTPVLVDAKGARIDLGSAGIGLASIQSYAYPGQEGKFAGGFSASTGNDKIYSGGVDALFYGPKANEIAGTFGFSFSLADAGWSGTAQGVLGAKR